MDSMDLEREKGITILAKNTAIDYTSRRVTRSRSTSSTRPATRTSAARSSGACRWSTVSLLLVDAAEGPLPQTRFVLRKALGLETPGRSRHQQGRPLRRADRRSRRRDVRAASWTCSTRPRTRPRRSTSRSCTRSAQGRSGHRSNAQRTARCPPTPTCARSSRPSSSAIPPPVYDDSAPLQAQVTNLDASPYLGRIALCRVHNGTIAKGQTVAWCRTDGTVERVKVSELFTTRARAGAHRISRSRRHHRDRRHRRHHDRRNAGRHRTIRARCR